MKVILFIASFIVLTFSADFITSRKLLNKYKMFGIFGLPGSGKSTYLTMLMYKHVKKGWEVYTDDPSVKIDGVKYFDSMALKGGSYLPDGRKGYINEFGYTNKENRNIVLFFDEIGILYNNRQFKDNLSTDTLEWWKKHRHKRVKIFYGSQSYKDMDLKLRSITDQLYLVKRGILKNFSVAKPILIRMEIQNNEQGDNSGGQIVEKYSYDVIFFWKFILLQKWIKKFNSFN